MTKPDDITLGSIRQLLSQRVSSYNANLMLNTAVAHAGLKRSDQEVLNQDEARALCMALINRGGPSFQVGKSLLQTIQ